MEADHNLVIVGGGVAGLDIATHLAGKRAHGRRLNVTLIDRETAYVWKPMLHTIAAGTSEASAQQTVMRHKLPGLVFGTNWEKRSRSTAMPARCSSRRFASRVRKSCRNGRLPTTRSF